MNSGNALLVDVAQDEVHAIVKQLVDNDVIVHETSPHRQTLEDYFLSITSGENHHVD